MKNERVCLVNRIFEELREEEGAAQTIAEDAEETVENLRKKLKFAEMAATAAHGELRRLKILRRKTQKRSLFLTQDAMKDDDSDLGTHFTNY